MVTTPKTQGRRFKVNAQQQGVYKAANKQILCIGLVKQETGSQRQL
jgi:hypothetical protein